MRPARAELFDANGRSDGLTDRHDTLYIDYQLDAPIIIYS